MPRILGFFVAAWTVGMALPAQAQQAVLSQLYGQGVHEFYGGDYQAARQSLTEAAANDSRDPRVYYYRALANLRLGDESAAKSDFDTAAALEFTPAGRQFAVSRSLQRVQGRERQTLEKHRAQAKMTAYRAAEQRRQARYGREQQADFDELREQAVAPATAFDRGLPPGTESVDVPKRPATVIDPAMDADSEADKQAPASGIGGIVGRALGASDAPPTPPVVAPTTPPPAAAMPPAETGDLFGDEEEAAVEPTAEEPDALEVTEDPVPADDILDPEPEATPAATEGSASEPTAPAPADEGDPFADSAAPADGAKAPADEAAAPPATDEAPLAEEAPFEEEPALEEPAKTAPAAPEVEDTFEAPAAEMPATEAPAAAGDSLDDALPADAPPADPALEAEAPLDDPAAPAADPLTEEPLGEEPAAAVEDPAAAPADAAPTAEPLAEEPAADPLFDEPAAEPATGDPAADAALEDPAADSADPALEEPAGESLEEMPAEPAAEESLEEAPAEEAPAEEAPLPE